MRRANLNHVNASLRKHESLITKVTFDILSQRPNHHGIAHSTRVCLLAERIAHTCRADAFLPTVRMCAIAHDIGDSKFTDDTPKWTAALTRVPSNALKFVQDVSTRVSFSREQAVGRNDWFPTLGAGVIIRAIVSDADKLDSLGCDGYLRLQEYNQEKLNARMRTHGHAPIITSQDYNMLLHDMIWQVIMLRQRPLTRYMQTQYGREVAPELFRQLVRQHRAWMRSVNL